MMHLSKKYAIVIWLIVLSLYILAGAAIVPFHGDEATLIYMGRDFYYQFVSGEWEQVLYNDPPLNPTEQHLRLLNGTIPKYLYGLAAYSLGYEIEDINEQWDWGADWQYNISTGHMPTAELLLRARLISSLFLVGGCWLIFWLGVYIGGYGIAYWASAFYALHPQLLLNGRRAMMEGALIFFIILVVLVAIHATRRRTWVAFIALGVASGLAIAAKHTAVFTVASVFLGLMLLPLVARLPQRVWARHIAQLASAGALACAIFYGLNPAWWGDALNRIGEVFALRADLLNGQVAFFGGYTHFGDQLRGFYHQVFTGTPQYYEVAAWADYIGASIQNYTASPWGGIQWGVGGIVISLLSLIGLIAIAGKGSDIGARIVVLVWTLTNLTSTLLLTPLEWGRYYLPALPIVALLSGYGLWQTTKALRLARESYDRTQQYSAL